MSADALNFGDLTVRVGVGWSPFERQQVGSTGFWRFVELLEDLSYDSLWLSDTATRPGPAPLPMLAAVAARTDRLKLGTSVLVVPPRPAVLLAKELATIDMISNGRLLPALGLGVDLAVEIDALGVARDERIARLEESLLIVRALWSGDPVTYRGRFCDLDEVTLSPKPLRNRLEIWLSGSSPGALRRTGRLADGWLASFVSPESFQQQADTIRAAAAEAGRSIDEDHYGVVVFAARTRGAQQRNLVALLERTGRTRPLVREDILGVGVEGVRIMLERFRGAGATKFVLIPLDTDDEDFLRELKVGAIDPVEAAR